MNLNYFIILGLAILIHELGHIIIDWASTRKFPKISIRWWGIEVKTDGSEMLLQKINSALAGPLWGYFVVLFFNLPTSYCLLYLLMCFIDFAIIVSLIDLGQKTSWRAEMKDFAMYYKRKKIEE